MKVIFQGDNKSIQLDIAGDDHAERVLLTHLQEGHVAILCPGNFEYGGVRVFIRNKCEIEYRHEVQDQEGRRGHLKRRKIDRYFVPKGRPIAKSPNRKSKQ